MECDSAIQPIRTQESGIMIKVITLVGSMRVRRFVLLTKKCQMAFLILLVST